MDDPKFTIVDLFHQYDAALLEMKRLIDCRGSDALFTAAKDDVIRLRDLIMQRAQNKALLATDDGNDDSVVDYGGQS